MKKTILLCVLFVITTSIFSACSSDDLVEINDVKLFGVWFENFTLEDNNQISRLEYRFNEDNTYEILRMRIDNTNGDILGYRYREVGNFSLRNDILFFTDTKRYVGEDSQQEEFHEIENLRLVSPDFNTNSSRKIEFGDNEKTLTFVAPPCNDTSSCLATPVLKKIDRFIF